MPRNHSKARKLFGAALVAFISLSLTLAACSSEEETTISEEEFTQERRELRQDLYAALDEIKLAIDSIQAGVSEAPPDSLPVIEKKVEELRDIEQNVEDRLDELETVDRTDWDEFASEVEMELYRLEQQLVT